jgi:hypothetical protein
MDVLSTFGQLRGGGLGADKFPGHPSCRPMPGDEFCSVLRIWMAPPHTPPAHPPHTTTHCADPRRAAAAKVSPVFVAKNSDHDGALNW